VIIQFCDHRVLRSSNFAILKEIRAGAEAVAQAPGLDLTETNGDEVLDIDKARSNRMPPGDKALPPGHAAPADFQRFHVSFPVGQLGFRLARGAGERTARSYSDPKRPWRLRERVLRRSMEAPMAMSRTAASTIAVTMSWIFVNCSPRKGKSIAFSFALEVRDSHRGDCRGGIALTWSLNPAGKERLLNIAHPEDFNENWAKREQGDLSSIDQTGCRKLRQPDLSSTKSRSEERVGLSEGWFYMEFSRCKVVAIGADDTRCKSLLTGVTIEMEDLRCKTLHASAGIEMEDRRCNPVGMELEDPRCKDLRLW
jgi:hypothetical protein